MTTISTRPEPASCQIVGRITPNMHAALARRAQEDDRSMNYILRQALAAYLEQTV